MTSLDFAAQASHKSSMNDTISRQYSFWRTLWDRRVPQIVGIYIAAWWMGVDIGQWLTENFGLSE